MITAEHPSYEITPAIRERYPDESVKWEEFLEKTRDPKNRGCLTCRLYSPPNQEFVDAEEVEGHVVPWDTEEAWVNCSRSEEHQTALRINCGYWR